MSSSSSQRIQPPEIEMLVAESRMATSLSSNGRRRWLLVAGLVILVLGVSIGVALAIVFGPDRGETVPSQSSQGIEDSAQDDDNNPSTAPTSSSSSGQPSYMTTQQDSSSLSPSNGETATASPQPGEFSTSWPSRQPSSQPSQETSSEPDYSTWLEATVTLDSGVMYEVMDQIPHDSNAFTQGLTFANGELFESTGLYGQSTVRQLNPETGDVLLSINLGDEYFGEGMAYVHGRLIQITWKEATAFIYNATDLTLPPSVSFYETTKNNEGWGITYDQANHELIVSDGSANLVFWDPDTLVTLRTLQVVRQNGEPATNMNELEYWRGRVLANVWYENVLLVIHPETGLVEKEYDMTSLWPSEEQPSGTDVLNGISVSEDPDILYVTGKLWNRIYRIKLLP